MSDSDPGSKAPSPAPESVQDNDGQGTPEPPAANPTLDMDDEDNAGGALSDLESDLSEVDEAEFADFDPTAVALEDRPQVDIDEDVVKTLKASKKKRTDGAPKKPKEGKRERKKKSRRADDDDVDPDGVTIDGRRARKPKRIDGEKSERTKERKATPEPENEELLDPAERRRRALDRAMDAALRGPNKRRRGKKDEEVGHPFTKDLTVCSPRLGSRECI